MTALARGDVKECISAERESLTGFRTDVVGGLRYGHPGYRDMGARESFPDGDNRFGVSQRDYLCFVKLQKKLV